MGLHDLIQFFIRNAALCVTFGWYFCFAVFFLLSLIKPMLTM